MIISKDRKIKLKIYVNWNYNELDFANDILNVGDEDLDKLIYDDLVP